MRPQEVGQQRHQQAPGQHATGEVQRGQARPDDVADAQVGRTDRGRRGEGDATYAHVLRIAFGGQLDQTLAHFADAQQHGVAGREDVECAEQVDGGAGAHVPEQDLGGARTLLAGDVDLGGGHRFRERQIGVFHHHAPEQGHEQNAEDAAHQHQGGGFPVGDRGIESLPGSRDHEGRNGEHRARGDGFADRAHRSGDVLLEDGALAQLQHGHADDGGRIGGGNGHARAQAQVGVGGAQDHGHDQAQQHGAEGELPHLGLLGNVRTMLAIHGNAVLAPDTCMIANGVGGDS